MDEKELKQIGAVMSLSSPNVRKDWKLVGACLYKMQEEGAHIKAGYRGFHPFVHDTFGMSKSKSKEILQAYKYLKKRHPHLV